MNLKIELGTGVKETLRQKLKRQLNFKLASLDSSVSSLAATLELDDAAPAGRRWYLCRLRAKLVNGGKHDVELRSLHPNICIADAASRLAREVSRRSRSISPLAAAAR